eukprot:6272111-Pyramimonas_sp.AAC.1
MKCCVLPRRNAQPLRGQRSALLQRLGQLKAPVASVRSGQNRARPPASPLAPPTLESGDSFTLRSPQGWPGPVWVCVGLH